MNVEDPISRLFSARRIAVIGASARSSHATGNNVIRNLQRSAFHGEIFVVHPSADRIEGVLATDRVQKLADIDVAVVAVAAPKVAGVLAELEAAGCRSAVVMSVGLSPEDLRGLAQYRGPERMLVHGPNCMGIISVAEPFTLWAEDDNLTGLNSGDIALVSQSGSGAIFVARGVQGAGFSRIISTGNEAATTTADYIAWLASDPLTSVIGIVVESISSAPRFREAVAAARVASKPIVALKVGRSESGARATAAHTGALLSSDSAYQALFDELDIPLVSDYDELSSTLQLLSVLGSRSIGQGRVGVITISGGQAALAADVAATVGVSLPAFSATTRHDLEAILAGSAINNPLDAASLPGVGEEEFQSAISVVGADPDIDVVMALLDAQITLSASELAYEQEYFDAALTADCEVPVVIASCSSHTIADTRVSTGSVGVLRGLSDALVAVRSATRNARPVPAQAARPIDLPDETELARLRARLRDAAGPVTGPLLADLLAAYGIDAVESGTFSSGIDAAAFADTIGYPVVVKVQSPDITHRTDVGGVVRDLRSPESVMSAIADIAASVRKHRPDAQIEGFEVQRQLDRHVEGFAGFVVDPVLGATVGVGLGGTMIELVADARYALAPLGTETAASLIRPGILGQLLSGYRAIHPPTALDGLTNLTSRLSWLGFDLADQLEAADLNPVMIEEISGEARIVDALLIARGPVPALPLAREYGFQAGT
ncbi:acetate--CoA ligase family protein [Microbacterium sp. Root180]|uniref:acetate--CoA ligase family protein n=1 Tax=Microbacterium sp. Root180 TaxID=1736483 RepID=UPI0006FD8240|nr:acetate--CoA ligase family protein [Microbacterium sp. Root180]KRB37214.1 hypothetical protein ASD93_14645 [Microbacterium sp. Root180]